MDTATVGWSSLAVFSLLAGLTLGAEVYLGVAQSDLPRHGPTPAWLRALWAAAGQLWVSDTRGNGFHLVGTWPESMASSWVDIPTHFVWMPQGQKISFVHRNALYVVQTE